MGLINQLITEGHHIVESFSVLTSPFCWLKHPLFVAPEISGDDSGANGGKSTSVLSTWITMDLAVIIYVCNIIYIYMKYIYVYYICVVDTALKNKCTYIYIYNCIIIYVQLFFKAVSTIHSDPHLSTISPCIQLLSPFC